MAGLGRNTAENSRARYGKVDTVEQGKITGGKKNNMMSSKDCADSADFKLMAVGICLCLQSSCFVENMPVLVGGVNRERTQD
jgi:hypothetical protein